MTKIGITKGMRGYFAVMYDEDGPIQSGIGSYATHDEAISESREWDIAEEIPTDMSVGPDHLDSTSIGSGSVD